MAELSTLARPYAKAVYLLADEAGSLDAWSSMLKELAALVRQPVVEQLLSSPDYTMGEKAQTLIDVAGDALDERGRNLLQLLAENRRLEVLPEISAQFEAFKAQRDKAVDVELFVTHELNDAQRDKLVQALSKRLNRDVNVTVTIDKSLLGGVLVRAGDTVIDGSIRGRLNKLAEALNT